ncbi:hypothetical protein [Rhizohabitans arisaemae]|nr:hypothetical protein [Rhizohabitans arisaemae]
MAPPGTRPERILRIRYGLRPKAVALLQRRAPKSAAQLWTGTPADVPPF